MEGDVLTESNLNKIEKTMTSNTPREWRWISIYFYAFLHLHAIYFMYAILTSQVYFSTVLFRKYDTFHKNLTYFNLFKTKPASLRLNSLK